MGLIPRYHLFSRQLNLPGTFPDEHQVSAITGAPVPVYLFPNQRPYLNDDGQNHWIGYVLRQLFRATFGKRTLEGLSAWF